MRIFELQGSLCLMILIGAFLGRRGIIDSKGRALLSDLLIYVIVPCNTIVAFASEAQPVHSNTIFRILLVFTVVETLITVIGKQTIMKFVEPSKAKVLLFGMISSNVAMVGLPIVDAFLGTRAYLYATIAILPIRVFLWASGVLIFAVSGDSSKKNMVKTVFTHPCIIAAVLGIIIMFTGLQIPSIIFTSLETVGSCFKGTAMILMGAFLHNISLKDFKDKSMYIYSLFRLILLPLLVFSILCLINIDKTIIQVATVLFAMPAPFLGVVFAEKYKANAAYASRCMLFTTVVSIATIPLLMLLVY